MRSLSILEHGFGPPPTTSTEASFARPYVISWNITYRCNLACEHCYLDAGPRSKGDDALFADRSELTTTECHTVLDQIAAFAPEALVILTGGEPLLRRDILEIVRHGVARDLWIVIGTNGVRITLDLAKRLRDEGVRGLALSLDALEPEAHDRFRRVRGAWQNTVDGADFLNHVELPFIVQTTVGAHNRRELAELAELASVRLRAKVWNLYFLVPTGRGEFVSDLTPEEHDEVLAELSEIQAAYRGRMIVNAKCAPHHVRHLLQDGSATDRLKAYSGGAGGCPAGTHYLGIRPNGDVTPCPYLPQFDGNVKTHDLSTIWTSSPLFSTIRARNSLRGTCGECELARLCGGCRARAWSATGDVLAADPLCTHVPGSSPVKPETLHLEYGCAPDRQIEWHPAAEERIRRIPAFVRGMVVRRVEERCRAAGQRAVTVELLEELRANSPAAALFRRPAR